MKQGTRNRIRWGSAVCFALIGAGFYLLVCGGCAHYQRKFIYFPPVLPSERVAELAAADRLTVWQSLAGKPVGWKRLCPEQPSDGQIIILHGNGGGAFQCGHYSDALQGAGKLDVFIVEYPGYVVP